MTSDERDALRKYIEVHRAPHSGAVNLDAAMIIAILTLLGTHVLAWMKTPPTVEGAYWYREGNTAEVVRVDELDGKLTACQWGIEIERDLDLLKGEWAGPIPLPRGVTQ